MSKLIKILLIILLSLLVMGITIFFVGVLKNKSFSFITRESTEIAFNEQYDNTFNNIKVKSKFGNIFIKSEDTPTVKVIVYDDKENAIVNATSNDLYVESSADDCKIFCFNRTISKIEISLPYNYEGTLTVDNNYGNIYVGEFDNMILDASLDAGNITVKSARRIKVDNNFGDIDIDKVTEYMIVDESFGNITIGEVILKDNSIVENSFGNITIGRTNEIKIEAKTSLGKAKIHKNYDDSNIILNIKNSFGNITVNN